MINKELIHNITYATVLVLCWLSVLVHGIFLITLSTEIKHLTKNNYEYAVMVRNMTRGYFNERIVEMEKKINSLVIIFDRVKYIPKKKWWEVWK